MQISYTTNKKKFRKVYFLSGNPVTGNRVVLDPSDFGEMQDIWLEQLDNFVKAIRGSDSGIVEGCEVFLQATTDGWFEIVLNRGKMYVNSTMVQVMEAHSYRLPVPNWTGVKTFYFIAKPVIKTFIPSVIGEPGFSTLAGRPTSNRAEIAFDLELVDTLPTNEWYILLAEIRMNESVNSISDIELNLESRNVLMQMRDIQDAAVYAKAVLDEHLTFYFDEQELIGVVDGANKIFKSKYAIMKGTEIKVFKNHVELATSDYSVTTTEDWETSHINPVSTIEVSIAPVNDEILTISYYPEQHIQYLSKFRFAEHIGSESPDHDNRYYTETEVDTWRTAHNVDVTAHPTHVLWTDFNAWVAQHTSASTSDHDQTYSRLDHGHTIDDVQNLRKNLNSLSEQIGYGNDDFYIVTQQITDNVDGVNTIFTVNNQLINDGLGYVRSVRADITNDAVRNPAVLSVIDATENFTSPTVGAFSEPKLLSQRFLNNNPSACVQLDDEVWAVWVAKESETSSHIWFASYAQGNGFFSPATSTMLACNPDSRVSISVVYSLDPTINQRIVMVWDYNNQLYYSHIDRGQTDWRNAVPLPNTVGAKDAAICWVDDDVTSSGRLHVLYTKPAASGKTAIYRKLYEIDLLEVDVETAITFGDIDTVHPVIVQATDTEKKVWYGWIAKEENFGWAPGVIIDNDNSCKLQYKIIDKYSPTVYQETAVLGGVENLNVASGLAFIRQPTGIWIQYSIYENGQYNLYYKEFDFVSNAVSDAVFLEKGTQVGGAVSSDGVVWIIYQYLNSIYFRAREAGAGEVKWNLATKTLEFERAPVSIPIFVDIALPLRSLNLRVSELESMRSDTEELMMQNIRHVIDSMGLNIPQEYINALREKTIVEADIEIDTRRKSYGYQKVIYNKFFFADNGLPTGINNTVSKGGNAVLFVDSGLTHENTGKIINTTNQIIKIYSTIYNTSYFSDGHIMVDMHGDLQCLAIKITSQMNTSPLAGGISWIEVADSELGQPLDWSGNVNFVNTQDFGVEIEILPGGWLYDWALFTNTI